MSFFSELLTMFSKRAGMNSPQIARYCGLDRVTVYRFLKGKTLPKDRETVQSMAEILQLACDERELLTEVYESERIGPGVYLQRKYIRSFMKFFSGKTPLVPVLQYETDDMEETDRETMLISGRDFVIKRIQKEILTEVSKAEARIDLVMRPGISPVMDMLLSAGKKNRALEVRHLIPIKNNAFLSATDEITSPFGGHHPIAVQTPFSFEDSLFSSAQFGTAHADTNIVMSAAAAVGDGPLQQDVMTNYELLRNFFKVTCMFATGFTYSPSYFYTHYGALNQFPLYANILLTEKAAILFSDDLREAILFQASDHVSTFQRRFDRFSQGKPVFAHVFRDMPSFIDNMNRFMIHRERKKEETEYYYTSLPCLIPVLTDEIIQRHIRMDILIENSDMTGLPAEPGFSSERNGKGRREADKSAVESEGNIDVLKEIYGYVNAIRARYMHDDINQITFFTESGLRAFLKTGRFAEVPPELYTPLSEEERRQMLLAIADHPHYKVRILRQELSAPDGLLCVEVMDRALFLEFLVPGKGMCFLYVNEPGILLAFRSFFSEYPENELYTEEETKEILRRLATET